VINIIAAKSHSSGDATEIMSCQAHGGHLFPKCKFLEIMHENQLAGSDSNTGAPRKYALQCHAQWLE